MLLHSKIIGEGPPFLVFHGLFGMGDNWMTLGRKWAAQGYEVHLMDLRNHGKSPKSEEINHKIISSDIAHYIHHHKLKNPIALGHSLGGKAIMHFCLQFPEIFSKIIVADIAPKIYPLHHQLIFEVLKKVDFDKIQSRKHLDEFLAEFIKEADIRALILKNTYLKENARLDFMFHWRALEKNYKYLLQTELNNTSYKNPALFLKAEKSNYILESDFQNIYTYFPNAKILNIKNARHWLQFDNPEEVYEKVINFIK